MSSEPPSSPENKSENTSTSRRVALITGITGQDGSYLCELLLEKGYDEVHGIIRRSSSYSTSRIHHLYGDPKSHKEYKMKRHYGDMADSSSLVKIIASVRPTEIYNLAGKLSWVGLYEDEKTITCSGSLVAYQCILTAASCFDDSKKIQYAMAGDVHARTFEDSLSTRKFIKVINSTLHPNMVDHYKNNSLEIWNEYDIAILKTETPFPENENIRTIEIEQKELDIGTHALILGFRLGANSLSEYHRALSFLSVKILACPFQPVNSDGTLICAATTKGTSGNPGGKGGPLISKHPPYKLYGVFSDVAGQMNLVTNAWSLQSWIKEQLV